MLEDLWARLTESLARTLPTGKLPAGQVLALAFSPDGQRLAAASNDGQRGGDSAIRLWEVSTGKVVREVFA